MRSVKIGERFGMVVIDGPTYKVKSRDYAMALCDCGVRRPFQVRYLIQEKTFSCGCLSPMINLFCKQKTHNYRSRYADAMHIKLYHTWSSIKSRCHNTKNKDYKKYGAKGISVCDKWRDSFEAFLLDMGEPPTQKHTIERENSKGDYEPNNCKWANYTEQANNRSNNTTIKFDGKIKTLSQWSKELGIRSDTLSNRIKKGWPIEKAMLTATRPWGKTRW